MLQTTDNWLAAAADTAVEADHAAAAHRLAAASLLFRRAAASYAAALQLLDVDEDPQRVRTIRRRQHACWERAVDCAGGERLSVPYGEVSLPAWFFTAARGERRPLVIVNHGTDTAAVSAWPYGATAAARGYHWLTFDGPGQPYALNELGLPLRTDWESVLTPILDAVLARDDVDGRVAVIGLDEAGLWVPRALAFEHRFTAAVSDPGRVDPCASWADTLPPHLLRALEVGQAAEFDREMHLAELFDPEARERHLRRARPFGLERGSRFRLYELAATQRLGHEVAAITTPLLVAGHDDHSHRLYERLPGPKALLDTQLERVARDARIFDWIDGVLSVAAAPDTHAERMHGSTSRH